MPLERPLRCIGGGVPELYCLVTDADASIFESGEKATDLTKSLCPSSVCCSMPNELA
jgi:hypothetical protein